jgi:hypothetical protein
MNIPAYVHGCCGNHEKPQDSLSSNQYLDPGSPNEQVKDNVNRLIFCLNPKIQHLQHKSLQNGNEVSGFIKGRKFTDQLSDWPYLKKDFTPLS